MPHQNAPLAVVELTNNATIIVEAVDPVSGTPVSGVVVSNVAISAIDLSNADAAQPTLPPAPVTGAYTSA